MRLLRWIAVAGCLLGTVAEGRPSEPVPPPFDFSPSAPAREVAEGPKLFPVAPPEETHCLPNLLARLRMAPMACNRLANPSKYPPVVPVLAPPARSGLGFAPPVDSRIERVQYLPMPGSAAAAPTPPLPVAATESEPVREQPVETRRRFSLFGLSRIHTATPACGVLQPCAKPVHSLLKSHAEKAACDPFKKAKATCSTCTDRSYLEQGRPLVEKANCRDLPNEPRAYKLLGGSPRCDVTIKDPDYQGALTPTPVPYQPLKPSDRVPATEEPASTQGKSRMPFLTTLFNKKAKEPPAADKEQPPVKPKI